MFALLAVSDADPDWKYVNADCFLISNRKLKNVFYQKKKYSKYPSERCFENLKRCIVKYSSMNLYIYSLVYINMYFIQFILLNIIFHIDILVCIWGHGMNETNWEKKSIAKANGKDLWHLSNSPTKSAVSPWFLFDHMILFRKCIKLTFNTSNTLTLAPAFMIWRWSRRQHQILKVSRITHMPTY